MGGFSLKTIAKFDFGNMTVLQKPDYLKVERVYCSPKYIWINELRNTWRKEISESPYRDFVSAIKGEFRMGLTEGDYIIKLIFYDPNENHGPFTIRVSSVAPRARMGEGKLIVSISDILIQKGIIHTEEIKVRHSGEALAINFTAEEGGLFIVNAMELEGPDNVDFTVLFPDAPSDILPSIKEVETEGRDDPYKALKEVCDWLMKSRTADGFIGDYEHGMKLWYTAAYPIRTFFSAYRIFGEKKYYDACVEILDKLVVEQMPESSFTQAYRNQPTVCMSESELDAVRAKYWMNLADVGSVVTTLAYACDYVTGERKVNYINAVRKYCDNWASKFQKPEGGFTNGWIPGWAEGNYAKNIYSVATATTALTFAIFSKITGESKYMETAEKALAFMINNWNEDGRPYTWAHDNQCPAIARYQDVLEFGDLLYTHEGVIAVARLSENKELRKKTFEACRKHLFGSRGLLACKKDASWWPVQDAWTNSKSVGMLITILDFLYVGKEFDATEDEIRTVAKEYELCKKFLCTPKFSAQMGVMLEDPDNVPFSPHGVQSWTGCAVAATGFAGIALAEMIKPGITYSTKN